ncbi:MAG: hypothetical protein R6X15_03265 [Pseudomonadota bacterium]
MKRQATPRLSDEKLNAFIDDELDFAEKEQIFFQLSQDDELYRETRELQQLRALLRHAYRHPPPAPQHKHPKKRMGGGLSRAVAAIALLTLGVLTGWYGNEKLTPEPATALALQHPGTAQEAVATEQRNLLLHINSGDPARMEALLDYAERLLAENRRQNRDFRLEVVANDGGIDILRADTSPHSRRIRALLSEYDNLTVNACSNALRRLRERGVTVELIPGTRYNHTAIDKITERLEQGWRYLRV